MDKDLAVVDHALEDVVTLSEHDRLTIEPFILARVLRQRYGVAMLDINFADSVSVTVNEPGPCSVLL